MGTQAQKYNPFILKVSASQLLDLFPDEIIIQQKTISIIKRELLATYVETIPIKDIAEVTLTESGLFASITITVKATNQTLEIKKLPTSEAKKAKQIIDQLIIEQDDSYL